MARAAKLLLGALILCGCSSEPHRPRPEHDEGRFHQFELYKQGNGRVAIVCTGNSSYASCATNGWPDQSFRDCSAPGLPCVFDEYNVLAVPSGDVTMNQTYEAFGARLKVERCFGDDKQCDVALISSTCSAESTCVCRRADVGKTKLLFYWSRDLGVTAFYSVPSASPSEIKDRGFDPEDLAAATPLRTFFLVGTQGFLRAPIPVKAAKLITDCK